MCSSCVCIFACSLTGTTFLGRMCVGLCVCMCVCGWYVYECVCACVYVRVYMQIHVWVCVSCVCTCVHAYCVWIGIQSGIQSHFPPSPKWTIVKFAGIKIGRHECVPTALLSASRAPLNKHETFWRVYTASKFFFLQLSNGPFTQTEFFCVWGGYD